MGTTWDIVVVGAGPAGAATAITLSRFGWRVLLVERRTAARFKLGESLPPDAIGLVQHYLGALEGPQQVFRDFYKTVGNVAVWGGERPDTKDFFFTANGFGLCVDRLAFDEALRSKAVAAGTTLLKGARFKSCVRIDERFLNWRLTLDTHAGERAHYSRYLVDCSGRRAVVAKRLGVGVTNDDLLFAYARWFACPGVDDDCYTRIEAGRYGWWYSNRLPRLNSNETQRLVVFHTDKKLPEGRMAANPQGYDQLLGESGHVAPLLDSARYQPHKFIRGAPAGSQRLRRFAGDGWLAAGDAAQAYDPLSSQGIDKALKTASHAGHMIHYALTDSSHCAEELGMRNAYIQQYDEQQKQFWQAYLSHRHFYYGAQHCWFDQPFWQGQRSVLPAGSGKW